MSFEEAIHRERIQKVEEYTEKEQEQIKQENILLSLKEHKNMSLKSLKNGILSDIV